MVKDEQILLIFHAPAYPHGFMALSVLVTHCHGSCGKKKYGIYHEHFLFDFNNLKQCQTLMNFVRFVTKPSQVGLI